MTDIEIAMAEMAETAAELTDMSLPAGFAAQLDRVRLDMHVSPYITLTDNMCKWVILAYKRSLTESKS